MPGFETVTGGDFRLSGFAATKLATLIEQPGPGRSMNGPIHTPATKQRLIGRIDNRVDVQWRDVALHDLHPPEEIQIK
jgi:hypothetical protein